MGEAAATAKKPKPPERQNGGTPTGIPQSLMHRLSLYEAALDSPAQLKVLREEPRRTPASFAWNDLFPGAVKSPGITANYRALFGAVALVDAVDLRCPGTDEGRSIQLVETLFERQVSRGFMEGEVFSSSHGQLWDGAFAAILYVAQKRRIEGLRDVAAAWWRQRLDVWQDHVTNDDRILIPCLRGGERGNTSLSLNSSCDLIHQFIHKGHKRKLADENRYNVGPRLFYRMENVELRTPERLYPLHSTLRRLRYSDGYISYFYHLDGLKAQWMVGTTARKPEGAVDVPGGWAVLADGTPAEQKGGPCPVQPPEGWTSEKLYGPALSVLATSRFDGDDEEEGSTDEAQAGER